MPFSAVTWDRTGGARRLIKYRKPLTFCRTGSSPICHGLQSNNIYMFNIRIVKIRRKYILAWERAFEKAEEGLICVSGGIKVG